MNTNFTLEIDNEALIIFGDLCLEIPNKVFDHQLGLSSPNHSGAASSSVEFRREQNYNTGESFIVCAIKYS